MKRIAFFAHFDRDGLIDDYVIHYLRSLGHVADRILFVSDCELRQGEVQRLEGVAEFVHAGRHGEYDFGSWKRAFAFLGSDLSHWDELILANDSCYAPVHPFESVFSKMASVDCDFWGAGGVAQCGLFDHLHSYFLVFRKAVLSDEAFLAFWPAVAAQESVDEVVRLYEIGLSRLLFRKGFRPGSWLPLRPVGSLLTRGSLLREFDPGRTAWVKVRLLRDNPTPVARLREFVGRVGDRFPRELIDAHVRRMIGAPDAQHWDYRFGAQEFRAGALVITTKFKTRRARPAGRLWWKLHVRVRGLRLIALSLPLPRSFQARPSVR